MGDLSTKAAAQRLLADDSTHFSNWLRLAVLHNEGGAFGWSVGIYTWQLNLAITLATIVFVVPVSRDLARIDSASPVALGLIVGGALGNLASLISSPAGVVDFISVRYSSSGELVLNVADAAAYVGLVMIVRTGILIADAIRRDVDIFAVARTDAVMSLFAERLDAKRALREADRVRVARGDARLRRGAGDVVVIHRDGRFHSGGSLADAPPQSSSGIDDVRVFRVQAPGNVRHVSERGRTERGTDGGERAP